MNGDETTDDEEKCNVRERPTSSSFSSSSSSRTALLRGCDWTVPFSTFSAFLLSLSLFFSCPPAPRRDRTAWENEERRDAASRLSDIWRAHGRRCTRVYIAGTCACAMYVTRVGITLSTYTFVNGDQIIARPCLQVSGAMNTRCGEPRRSKWWLRDIVPCWPIFCWLLRDDKVHCYPAAIWALIMLTCFFFFFFFFFFFNDILIYMPIDLWVPRVSN